MSGGIYNTIEQRIVELHRELIDAQSDLEVEHTRARAKRVRDIKEMLDYNCNFFTMITTAPVDTDYLH
jgi:tRNA U54 and U55 pseudouridine synthase Pus10